MSKPLRKDKARERRTDKRVLDAGLGRKKTSDVLIEEAAEHAIDWLERGGARRIWTVFKILGAIVAVIIATILIIIFGQAS